jgi:hypothetical protein
METVIDEILRAVAELALAPDQFRQLPSEESEAVFLAALRKFVASGDRRWWWEDFRTPGTSLHFAAGDGWRHMTDFAPNPNENVWFIAEDDQLPHYPVFETTPRHAVEIIGECYGFEFYLVAKDLSWLLCETHHDVVYAVGQAVEKRLLKRAV